MAKDYYANVHRSMLAVVKEVGAMPFILFEYYLTWQTAPDGIKPSLQRVADDLGLAKNAVCNLRSKLIKAGWIEFKNDEVFIKKSFTKNESDSQKMNESFTKNEQSFTKNEQSFTKNEQSFTKNESHIRNSIIRNNREEQKEQKTDAVASDVSAVFDHWKKTLNHPNAKLDKTRAAKIRARLNDGFSAADLLTAVSGVMRSPYHLGENDSKTRYDDFKIIFRDVPQVEKFIALGATQEAAPEYTSIYEQIKANAPQQAIYDAERAIRNAELKKQTAELMRSGQLNQSNSRTQNQRCN